MWPRPTGQLQDCNDAFVRMLGLSNREEAMALNLDEEVYVSPGAQTGIPAGSGKQQFCT